MKTVSSSELTEKIIEKAKSLGAFVAGVAGFEVLKASPSHRIYPQIGMNLEVTWQDATGNTHGETTTTEDLSVSGCFIVCHHLIQKGCKISVEIDLSIAEAGIIGKRVSAEGRVVRNGPVAGNPTRGFGHGVIFDKFHFS